MWDIKEEDLDKFRMTCQGRLSPVGATGFMLGTIFYTSLFMVIIFWEEWIIILPCLIR